MMRVDFAGVFFTLIRKKQGRGAQFEKCGHVDGVPSALAVCFFQGMNKSQVHVGGVSGEI